MSIAVDQTRLRRIVEALRVGETLDRAGALTILEIAQLAAGVGPEDDPAEHATLQAIAQHVGSLVGTKPGELLAIPQLPDEDARAGHLALLASQLHTRAARELAYAIAFLVSVADLQLTPAETAALEEFQRALGIDDRRATDLVVLVSEIVAAGDSAA
ncbi:MAG TPA: hypothetical protein VK932_10085 [Kofleriaceae bacterium]|nr:hypothetical protein [Kofleriaceae bacterium]